MAPRRSQALGLLAVLGFVALGLAKDASSKTEEEEPTPTLEWAKKMYELDSNNFAQTMQSYEHTAVIFYNSWENSSKRLGKIFSDAEKILEDHHQPCHFARVNMKNPKNEPFFDILQETGVPAIMIFRGEEDFPFRYKGSYTDAKAMAEYIKNRIDHDSHMIKTEDLQTYIDNNVVLVQGVFKDDYVPEFKIFLEVAEEVGDHYKFVHWFTGIDDLAVRLYVQHDTFHDDEVLEFDFSDESYPFTSENFHVFVEAHASPLVLDMDRSHSSMMFLSKYMLHPTHKVVFLADYSKLEAEKVYDKFLVEAKNRYRDFKFAMGDLQWNQETIQYFMLEDDMFPVLIIHWNNPDPNIQDTVYRNVHIDHVEDLGLILDASLEQYNNNTKVLQGYREKAERGELEEKYKSQEVPKHNTMPVKVVVADSWNEQVVDAGVDVVIHFYNPTCMLCKQLFPLMTKEAIKYDKKKAAIKFIKMDRSLNSINEAKFRRYRKAPTVLYYKHKTKQVVEFTGDAVENNQDLIDFIATNFGAHTEL